MFKKINKRSIGLFAVLLFAYIGLTATDSFAFRKVCWHGGHCRYRLGSCEENGYNHDGTSTSTAWTCRDLLIAKPDPSKDYILKKPNGQAFIVLGNDVTEIASDKLENFVKEMDSKYPFGKREDKATQQKMETEIDNFFKKTDDGIVSQASLDKWSKETGFAILDKAPSASEAGKITLKYPRLDSKIDLDSKQPITFEWTSTNVKGPYTLKLFVMGKGQTPEQAMKDKPFYTKEGITTTSEKVPYSDYGINEPGVKIMWTVSSGDVVSPYSAINTTRSNRKFNTGK